MRKLFLTTVILPFIIAPAAAGTYREPGVIAKAQSRQSMPANGPMRAGHNAFGMESPAAVLDSNSPALTGGGSLGYNRKLLEY